MSSAAGADAEMTGIRRLIILVVWDRRGDVEAYVSHALAGLRPHSAHLLVVVNGVLSDDGRARLEPVADEILVRENRGFDIWGHKDALDHLAGRIDEYDELILTNDTWFGPVRPYAPVFDRMGASGADFWGMTDHAREEPNPFTGTGVLFYHLQSFWIAVRRRMFTSDEWKGYWRDLPDMPGYFDAVLKHEAVFTQHFANAGFTHDVAFPSSDYPTDHPALFNPDLLLRDGCPLLKRRPFFHYPTFLDRHAVIGRELLGEVAGYGYPIEMIWEDLARNVAPRVANANTAALEVLTDRASSRAAGEDPPRIAILMHVEDIDGVPDALAHAKHLPVTSDLIVTVPSTIDVEQVQAGLERDGAHEAFSRAQVREIPAPGANRMSSLLVACRDVLRGNGHDLIVRLVASSPRPESFNADRYMARHQLDNLLGSPGYASNILDLFAREQGLGGVFPPTAQFGTAHLGAGWGTMRRRGEELAADLGIRVPFDEVSPLAPYGGMMVFRPDALDILLGRNWRYEDYVANSAGAEAPLEEVQERLVAYAMGEKGYHCRTVLSMEHADISHTAMEFVLDQMSSTTPGYPVEQIQFLQRAGRAGSGSAWDLARMYLRLNHPKAVSVAASTARRLSRSLSRFGRGRGGVK